MAIVRPFKGYRPGKGLENKIPSLPYDVLNSEEARELAKGNKYAFYRVTKPEIDLDPKINLYDEKVYQTAKSNLNSFIDNGWLIQDKKEMLYVYKQKMGKHEQYGLATCVSCDDYDNDIIKKHEFTRKDKEDDRAKHVYVTNSNTGPVFLAYEASSTIDKIVATIIKNFKPSSDFVAEDGIGHTLWPIEDEQTIKEIVDEFKKIKYLYVADGHHRAASGSRTRKQRQAENKNHTGKEEYNFFLAVVFPHNQLQILPYNRVVKDLNKLDDNTFMKKLENVFEIMKTDIKEPKEVHNISMYLNKTWYSLKFKKEIFENKNALESLDVALFQKNILDPILGIKDPRTDKRVNFIGGIRGTKELEKIVDSGEYRLAFSMFPTRMIDIINVANMGEVMPPKSTWFEPKLRCGMVVHMLD